jgi:hypothetical protein
MWYLGATHIFFFKQNTTGIPSMPVEIWDYATLRLPAG